ncbi:hypothetical protein ACF3M1_03615 [Luteimonas sp. WGS1318]|uniref:hypothetical protein n=1 Tax=Luteimonas sp. WGS1318 TaxID=3366815 RepID=UPI00372CF0FA
MRAVHCILIAAALTIAAPAAAQSLRIETEMSAAERSATGLDRLTDAERAQLNAWLARREAQAGASPQGTPDVDARVAAAREAGRREAMADAQGVRPAPQSREPIDSTIPGAFEGFARGREFTLANGQVWKQTDSTTLAGARGSDVGARIRPGALGVWWLQIEGYNRQAKVERVR